MTNKGFKRLDKKYNLYNCNLTIKNGGFNNILLIN